MILQGAPVVCAMAPAKNLAMCVLDLEKIVARPAMAREKSIVEGVGQVAC